MLLCSHPVIDLELKPARRDFRFVMFHLQRCLIGYDHSSVCQNCHQLSDVMNFVFHKGFFILITIYDIGIFDYFYS